MKLSVPLVLIHVILLRLVQARTVEHYQTVRLNVIVGKIPLCVLLLHLLAPWSPQDIALVAGILFSEMCRNEHVKQAWYVSTASV